MIIAALIWDAKEKAARRNPDSALEVKLAKVFLFVGMGVLFLSLFVLAGISSAASLDQDNPLRITDTRNELRTKIADTYGVEFSDSDLYTLKEGVKLKNSDDSTENPNSYVDSEKTVSRISDDYTTTREYKLRFISTDKVQLLEKTSDVADSDFTPAKPLSK